MQKEKKQLEKLNRNPNDNASTIRWLGLLLFIVFLFIVYIVFDQVAKQPKKGGRVVDFWMVYKSLIIHLIYNILSTLIILKQQWINLISRR